MAITMSLLYIIMVNNDQLVYLLKKARKPPQEVYSILEITYWC